MIYEFAATQDLHGWDKPWAPGAGDNLLTDLSNSAESNGCKMVITGNHVKLTGTATSSGGRVALSSKKISMAAGTYKLYAFNVKGTATPAIAVQSGTTSIPTVNNVFTLESDIEDFNLGFNVTVGNSYDYECDLLISTSMDVESWTPYANVCMPEGFNIWDPDQQDYTQIYAGYVNTATRELFLRPVYAEYAGEELIGPWMSDIDPYEEDTTPTEGAFVIDFGGELTSYEITAFMLQTLLDSLGIRQHFTDGAGLLNSLMDQAQGRVRSEEELLHLSRPLKVIAIGDQLPAGLKIRPISKDVLPGLPGKFIR